jgi:hypothetical protein
MLSSHMAYKSWTEYYVSQLKQFSLLFFFFLGLETSFSSQSYYVTHYSDMDSLQVFQVRDTVKWSNSNANNLRWLLWLLSRYLETLLSQTIKSTSRITKQLTHNFNIHIIDHKYRSFPQNIFIEWRGNLSTA